MPSSDPANKGWAFERMNEIRPARVLDVGVGMGAYARLVRNLDFSVTLHGIEIWKPYIKAYELDNLYDEIFLADARQWDDFDYDLVILGDVLEHMTRGEAQELYSRISQSAKYCLLSIPIIHYPQGAELGNPYETHVEEDWKHEEIIASFDKIVMHKVFDITGIYLAKFGDQ